VSNFILRPFVNNNQPDCDHIEVELSTGDVAVPMNHLWLSIEERNLEAPENGHFACVHLSPREALALACHLMDWAREHLEDMPLLGDFGVQEEAEFDYTASIEQDYAEDEFESEIEEMYCQVCGSTLVNGQCPEDKFLIPSALRGPQHERDAFGDPCGCYQCRMGS
jgi:hypothetical protein